MHKGEVFVSLALVCTFKKTIKFFEVKGGPKV